ncbi:ABC transporter substrate-binding protein [Saccharothrix violaceirubra]|uniref:Osmoprotectant transport system substrate-binding protein n=1 Tax=Saccharothrix violaceirubra TaxID=413306 RepID=A0A7W7WTL8_9PSEU|nr:ABC transporter substrate-binding protein [Saccharothrix violaceirubra]MBB4963244.1 osmoprotectant transport system substrate-binding protein [Saccharothrix violaceirubra]
MKRTMAVIVTAAALLVSACGSKEDLSGASQQTASGGGEVVVGSADFTENKILAEIYAGALRTTGANVTVKSGIGARELVVKALQDKSLGVVPEYTGNLLNYFDKANTTTESAEVYTALKAKTPAGLEVLEKAEAEDKDALVVTKETAAGGVKSIADLGDGKYVLGAAGEWAQRWQTKIKDVYGVSFKEIKTTDAGGPVTVDALKNGSAQVVNLYTTSADIAANGFVALEDPKSLYPAQNVVPLLRSDAVDAKGKEALNKVSKGLTTAKLADLVKKVDVDKESVAKVAASFLASL